jgi:hypothetical protein
LGGKGGKGLGLMVLTFLDIMVFPEKSIKTIYNQYFIEVLSSWFQI